MQKLYKIDENDNVREWWMEIDGDRFRAHSGVIGGQTVISGWKTAKPKNTGKKNATTAEEQAILEVERRYRDQLETGGYYKTIEEAHRKEMTYFEPMTAHKWADHKDKIAYPFWSQPKLDGIRCVAQKSSIKTRQGKPLMSTPHVLELLQPIFEKFPRIVIDGELYNHELKHDFEKIVSLVRKTKPNEEDIAESARLVEFHIFDMYDPDQPNMLFEERNDFLREHIQTNEKIRLVRTDIVTNEDELDEFFGDYLEDGYEGQMIRTDSPYELKRSRVLLKRKEFEDAEFEIDRLESGVGNWDGACKRVYIKLEDGSIQRAGVRGTYPDLKKRLEEAHLYPGTDATVRFQGRTKDGKLRFPVVTFFWEKKRDL